jgi:hypothetical protein
MTIPQSRVQSIAKNSDGLLNHALGEALKDAELITDYAAEDELGTGHKLYTDLLCRRARGNIRLEVMWRAEDLRRGEMAKYILEKRTYCRSRGWLRTVLCGARRGLCRAGGM